MSGDSLCLIPSRIHPSSSMSGPGTVEKHTLTHRRAHTRVYQRKCFLPMLGNDDEQSLGQRLQQAWCVLASHYAASIRARSCTARWSSRRREGLSCLSRVRPEKHTSQWEHFFWYVPSCLGPTYIQLLFSTSSPCTLPFSFLLHSLFTVSQKWNKKATKNTLHPFSNVENVVKMFLIVIIKAKSGYV